LLFETDDLEFLLEICFTALDGLYDFLETAAFTGTELIFLAGELFF
jgi:hypothetical protein